MPCISKWRKEVSLDAVLLTFQHSDRSQTTLRTVRRNESNTTMSLRMNSEMGTDNVNIGIHSLMQEKM